MTKNKLKRFKKVNKSLLKLNSFYEDNVNELKKELDFFNSEEKLLNNRNFILKKFLLFKGYKEIDFKEFLNKKLIDLEISEEIKSKIRFYFSSFINSK